VSTQPVFEQLLILMVVVWTVAVFLRRFGLPTIMGELVMGVIVGPAVLGWVEPSEIIEVLAQMGIFFLMLHTGVETEPRAFFSALRNSLGVALVGAAGPFTACVAVALAFGLPPVTTVFVGLTMTATAVVITLKVLRELRLNHTPMARVIMASCVIDDLLTLVLFSIVAGVVHGGAAGPLGIAWVGFKALAFFAVVFAVGHYLYPLFNRPFRDRRGKGFTFLLILGLGFGLLAEAIGLHIILGAYMAGLFFREEVASRELIQKVEDRLKGIAYSFLGPIFFISLGFHITPEAITGSGLFLIAALTSACASFQVVSAGGMALRIGFSRVESLAVGIGMCGRAEMAFVLASIGLSLGAIDDMVFSALIFTAFLLNLITPIGLRWLTPILREEDGMQSFSE
jgi:Kef-type K+ transport system membrane component KefB